MSIPPPPGPHQPSAPQDSFQAPAEQNPFQAPGEQNPFQAPTDQGPFQAPTLQGPYQNPYPQGPYAQGPYGPPYQPWGQGYSPFARPAPVNGVAIASLVLGLLCFLPAVGLVLGVIALVQIGKKGERGKGLAIAGSVLSCVGLALWVVLLATGAGSGMWEGFKDGVGGNGSMSLAKGECFDVPGDSLEDAVYDADQVPCTGRHDGEVFATIPLPGDSFPGDDHVTDVAEDKCYTLQESYTMDFWAVPDYVDVYYLTPTEESWDVGDREITCVYGNTDESGTLTGSLRSDATTLDTDQMALLKALNAIDTVLYEEPEDYAEDDLDGNKDWAADVENMLGAQIEALRGHTWPAGAQRPVAALVKDMEQARKDWAKAAAAGDADTFYEHYDSGYEYVDGKTTVTARKALGLATTPPSYDEDYDSGGGSGGSGNLDV
ncbi:DUF4190 domain-containing protein [Streptomyces sp. HUAS ZL42]|uniref:DUF4190 domain-containing protein n=1 Tax=Streptomyces sp. HUAS ZL42 TaxID=3231715 RepID=UPI00345E7425